MNKQEFITMLKGRCANNTDDTLDEAIVLEADLAQQEAERYSVKPWFLISRLARATTQTNRLELPQDFIGEFEEGALWNMLPGNEESLKEMEKMDYWEAKAQYPGEGRPKAYTIVGDYIYLFPKPDKEYEVRWLYYKSQPKISDLGDTEENLWLTEGAAWLIAKTGKTIAAQYLRDDNLAAKFVAQEQEARKDLHDETIRRIETNKERIMGSS